MKEYQAFKGIFDDKSSLMRVKPRPRTNMRPMVIDYGDSHYKAEPVIQPAQIYNGNPYIWYL